MSQHSIPAEALKQATRPKDTSAARLSHDLRTPLNIIIGFTELMLNEVPGPINDNQRQCLHDILSSSRRLLDLLKNTIDSPKTDASGERDTTPTKTGQTPSSV